MWLKWLPDNDVCENKKCSIEKELTHCYKCEEKLARKRNYWAKYKPYTFTLFAKKYGEEKLLDCLERNEKMELCIIEMASTEIMMILMM